MNMISTTSSAPCRFAQLACSASASRRLAGRERRLGRRAAASAPRPPANGQPEESLTCHQPISMPIRPEPGPDLPDAAARLADVLARHRARSDTGPARAASARAEPVGLLLVRALGDRHASRCRRSASSSRTRSSSPRSSSRGSPALAGGAASATHRVRGHESVGQLALEPGDLRRAATGGRRARARPGSNARCAESEFGSACDLLRRSSMASSQWWLAQLSTGLGIRSRLPAQRAPPRTATAPPPRGSPARRPPPTANSTIRVLRGADRVAGRDLAEQHRVHAPGVGHHQLPRRERARPSRRSSRSPARAVRMPRPPGVDPVGVERPHRDAGLDQRDQQGVRHQVLGAELAVQQPRHRRLLAGDPGGVGIEPDLAEEAR